MENTIYCETFKAILKWGKIKPIIESKKNFFSADPGFARHSEGS
jgi:hypothetical protein